MNVTRPLRPATVCATAGGRRARAQAEPRACEIEPRAIGAFLRWPHLHRDLSRGQQAPMFAAMGGATPWETHGVSACGSGLTARMVI